MQDRQSDDRPVRRAYLVVLIVPPVLAVALWAVVGADNAFTRVVYPAVVVLHGGLAAGVLTRRLSLRLVGWWVALFPAALLIARLAIWELGLESPPENLGVPVAVVGWFGVVFALAFLVFGTRRGAIVSLLGYVVLYLGSVVFASGGVLAESGVGVPVAYMAGGHAALIAVVWVLARNVERLAAARTKAELLELQASTDPLTVVANRRRLDDELERQIAQARRYDHPFSVVLIDLDGFKAINDTHGHEVGDGVLVETVDRLQAAIRDADLIGRWGGEEFLLLAPHTDHQAACALAERCRRATASSPMQHAGVTVTASLGVASLGPDDDARTLTRRADLAMYTAKSDGRDRVVGIPDIARPTRLRHPTSRKGTMGRRDCRVSIPGHVLPPFYRRPHLPHVLPRCATG